MEESQFVGPPLSVLMTSMHCCIRVCKQTEALRHHGHVSPLMFCNPLATKVDNFKDFISCFWIDQNDFRGMVHHFQSDIFHIHNEPDWMVWVAREERPDTVIVYDVHDLESIRQGGLLPSNDEIKAFEAADGIIWTSEDYQREAMKLYGDIIRDKPSAVVYSYCNAGSFVPPELFLRPHVPGVVYEGWARFPALGDPDDQHNMPFTNQAKVVQALSETGVPSYWYGVQENEDYLRFMQFGAHPMLVAPYSSLLRLITRYDWGIFGVEDKYLQMDRTLPNKIFEYLAAGLPVIVVNAEAAGNFIADHGFGLVLESYRQVRDVLGRAPEFKENVLKKRMDFTMETQVLTILDLYRRAAEYHRQRSADNGAARPKAD